MLISICIPCHNRAYDLKQILPRLIEIANASPPVEIAVLDYNSPDDLHELMERTLAGAMLAGGNLLTYRKYTGRSYYHMAHARNLSVRIAHGDFVVISSCDLWFGPDFIPRIRELAAEGSVWMRAGRYCGVVAIRRDEFIASGGFDERFEFYGPEDRDQELRMRRRGAKFGELDYNQIHCIPTPDAVKVQNYREQISKREMAKRMHAILDENIAQGSLVANAGKEWGAWD